MEYYTKKNENLFTICSLIRPLEVTHGQLWDFCVDKGYKIYPKYVWFLSTTTYVSVSQSVRVVLINIETQFHLMIFY